MKILYPCRGHPVGARVVLSPSHCFSERGCKGQQPLAGDRGAPEKLLFPFLLAACGGERGKRSPWGQPKPRQTRSAFVRPSGRPSLPTPSQMGQAERTVWPA